MYLAGCSGEYTFRMGEVLTFWFCFCFLNNCIWKYFPLILVLGENENYSENLKLALKVATYSTHIPGLLGGRPPARELEERS